MDLLYPCFSDLTMMINVMLSVMIFVDSLLTNTIGSTLIKVITISTQLRCTYYIYVTYDSQGIVLESYQQDVTDPFTTALITVSF